MLAPAANLLVDVGTADWRALLRWW